jgi:phage terminase Nu1 subunit (DNA packaging protein)
MPSKHDNLVRGPIGKIKNERRDLNIISDESAPQEAAKTPLEIWKTTFQEILQKMEAIPEEDQKRLYAVYKKHIDSLLSDTKELFKMHNKEKI